jgi:hypothetical protein
MWRLAGTFYALPSFADGSACGLPFVGDRFDILVDMSYNRLSYGFTFTTMASTKRQQPMTEELDDDLQD